MVNIDSRSRRHSVRQLLQAWNWLRIATLVTLAGLGIPGCSSNQPAENTSSSPQQGSSDRTNFDTTELADSITRFCGSCHAVPQPETFPKDAWFKEVRRGFDFYYSSGRKDVAIPDQSDVIAWYQARAPDVLPLPDETADSEGVIFQPDTATPGSPPASTPPSISFVARATGRNNSQEANPPVEFWLSDMKSGSVRRVSLTGEVTADFPNAALNPASIRIVDLNENGQDDLVIADLGSFLPEDHQRGKVLWLPDFEARRSLTPIPLLENVGRIADVRAADFDGDGDQDLVVAEFGRHTTGGIHLIYNENDGDDERLFITKRLDSRTGPIHVPVIDLDQDGRMDFIALISQEHEVVEAFLNRPDGFEKVRLFAAPDPSYGSSGIELSDFDGDGDQDVLYTNGDTFDSNLIKPYHGIWLLRNVGDLRFEPVRIASMPGVHRAIAGDVDLDGDQDIVAAALLPELSTQGRPGEDFQAIIWLEQKSPGQFARHVIKRSHPHYAAMILTDVDADGDPDIVAGCFSEAKTDPTLEIFRNGSGNGLP